MVLHAGQAQRLAVALAALALLAAGCGGGEKEQPAGSTVTVVHDDLGVDVRLADCTDWSRGDRGARLGTIHEIATALPGAAQLTDDQAYSLFENSCAERYATAFKLYKLYTRAAAFTPQDGTG